MESFQTKLDDLPANVEAITKAIDESIAYSYQYNLEIVRVPKRNERETAEETTSLCLKIFRKIFDILVKQITSALKRYK